MKPLDRITDEHLIDLAYDLWREVVPPFCPQFHSLDPDEEMRVYKGNQPDEYVIQTGGRHVLVRHVVEPDHSREFFSVIAYH